MADATSRRSWWSRVAASYTGGLEGVDRRAYVLVSLTLLSVASRMSVYTFLGIYFTREVGLGVALVGAAYLVENVARGLVAPVAGALTDRLGRRPVLLAAALATGATLPLFLLVKSAWALFAWSLLLGAAQGGMWPASSALLLDLSPPERRQAVLSLNYTALSIGYTLGVAPAGFLLAFGYPVLAAVSAAGYALLALVLVVGIRGSLPYAEERPRSSFLRDLATAPRDGAFLALASLAFVFPLGIGLIATVAPIYAQQSGLDEGGIGLALALNGPLLALLSIPTATWIGRWGPYRFLPLSALVLAASYVAFVFGGGFTEMVVASVVFTAGELVFSSALPTAVAQLAPPGLRGAYQGAWVFVFAIASGAALFLTGLLLPALGWSWTWVAWVAVTTLAAVGLAFARTAFRRTADARASAPR